MTTQYLNNGPVDCTIEQDLSKLRGKSVIVTGGSSGLGEAYVKAFLSAGAYVTNADINPSQDAMIAEAKNYQFLHCDVREWKEQLAVFNAAIKNSLHKSIDIVIANAGIAGRDSIFQLDDGDEPHEPDLKIVNINFIGVLYTTKLALHYFNKQPDHADRDKCLILKSSIAGYLDLLAAPQYQTSKFAVRGLMCNLRRTGKIRVNVIAPWFIQTSIMSETVTQMIKKQLEARGQEFAHIEDAVKAVMRVAADQTINGRGLSIVPRNMRKEGYADLEEDDRAEGTLLHELEISSAFMAYRALPPSQQDFYGFAYQGS